MILLVRAVLVGILLAGCVSFSHRYPTRPPEGRSAAEVARDERECEAYAEAQAKGKSDHYRYCMIGRGYTANVDMDHLGWTIGIVQTRPHEVAVVARDMEFCDYRADNTKTGDVVPPLTPEQERSLGGQAFAAWAMAVPGLAYQQRPNASRMLVACLVERGYVITPWVQFSGR